MEEFLPSAETEGIWGFTNAMEMVGGVSLFIFFTVFKQSKKKANISRHVSRSFLQWLFMKIPTAGIRTLQITLKIFEAIKALMCHSSSEDPFQSRVFKDFKSSTRNK